MYINIWGVYQFWEMLSLLARLSLKLLRVCMYMYTLNYDLQLRATAS